MKKILSLDQAQKFRKDLKKKKKSVALLNGVFDILHYGHILYFREAKNIADKIIISLTGDEYVNKGPDRPYNNILKRIEMLQSIEEIDCIVVNSSINAIDHINKIKPDFFIKGRDYKDFKNDITKNIQKEKEAIEKIGGKFMVTNAELMSSGKIINLLNTENNSKLKNLLDKINKRKLLKKFQKVLSKKNNKKLLIIGEPIVDRFVNVKLLGKSSKSNIISSSKITENIINGGTILAARTLSNFFKNIDIILPKSNGQNFQKVLQKNVNIININFKKYEPVIKNRYVDEYTKNPVFQLNENDQANLADSDSKKFLQTICKLNKRKKYHKIIIFDYGHGLINHELISSLKKLKKKILVNCQSNSSNYGYNTIEKYFSFNSISLDEEEFRLTVKNKNKPINELIVQNKKIIYSFENFILTMGKNGCYIISKKNRTVSYIPTIFENVKNTIGAGDVFFCLYIVAKTLKIFNDFEIGIISHIGTGLYLSNDKKKIVDGFDIAKTLQNLLK
jgi:rfaE bifunctional protein nucleotidyltransferase chain/domain